MCRDGENKVVTAGEPMSDEEDDSEEDEEMSDEEDDSEEDEEDESEEEEDDGTFEDDDRICCFMNLDANQEVKSLLYFGRVVEARLWKIGGRFEERDDGEIVAVDLVASHTSKLRPILYISNEDDYQRAEVSKFAFELYKLWKGEDVWYRVYLNIEGDSHPLDVRLVTEQGGRMVVMNEFKMGFDVSWSAFHDPAKLLAAFDV